MFNFAQKTIMFQREWAKTLQARLEERRQFIQVLSGPRQVGKTTLVRQVLDQCPIKSIYINADEATLVDSVWLQTQWQSARILAAQEKQAITLAIDEIQKIDHWSEIVKALWDADTATGLDIRVLLLGSSRLLIQKGLSESLTGRYELHYLPHWSYNEMRTAFGFTAEQYVWYGSYPGAATLINDESRWKSYIQLSIAEPSINRDILSLTRIDKPALLKRLFEFGCQYSGQMISYTKILGQLLDAGNTTTLAHYLLALDTAGLLSGLEKFSGDKLMQRSSSPKFQVQNNALMSSSLHFNLAETQAKPEIWGRLIESAIGCHFVNSTKHTDIEVFYWREVNDEVDFVLKRGHRILGVEVKSGKIRNKTGLSAFQKRFPDAQVLIVGQDSVLNWEEVLKLAPLELLG
jgi:uncharacterized protein